MRLDPVDYAVISQSLIAAAREMGAKMIRSAFSTIVREARDCSAALMDRDGNVVAQAELIPLQLGPMGTTFRPCAELFPVDTLEAGDFYINNDPFNGGQHLPDIYIFSPIFHGGRVIAFSATTAHHLDLGGGSPGLNAGATDVYQEGLRIPPSRYNLKRDWGPSGNFQRLVTANIRVPDQTIGDIDAQFAANAVGAERVGELCAKYGVDKIEAAMAELIAYSERRVRAALRAIPNGVYRGEDWVDDDGVSDAPLLVKATVTVKDDAIDIDFAGTCPQVARNLNAPFASTVSAALSCVKAVLTSPDIPFNEGVKRPIHVTAPLGSLLNPRPPAPVRARLEASYRVFNAVMKALAQAAPDRVIASGFDTTTVGCFSFLGPDGYRVYLEVFGGGYGASALGDGCDAVDSPLSNCSNTPIEAMDMEYDYIRVVEYALVPDSGGLGRHRGGLGFVRRYAVLKDGVTFALYADRFKGRPDGVFGGASGTLGRCEVLRAGRVIQLKSKDSMTLAKGDIVSLQMGGGAGYGPAAERPAALVERDLADGFVTTLKARAAE
ncbi:MAG: hydantoinase B/oxoprolinase family protein [Alphaproteobacteria bacterium]|nr:hydantoinase B/oxoprolinase family protein [Alphaproteobacteria bacterium]